MIISRNAYKILSERDFIDKGVLVRQEIFEKYLTNLKYYYLCTSYCYIYDYYVIKVNLMMLIILN